MKSIVQNWRGIAVFVIASASLLVSSLWVDAARRVPLVAPAAASEVGAQPAARGAAENPDVGEAASFPDDVADFQQLG